jgi:hypothetical protein
MMANDTKKQFKTFVIVALLEFCHPELVEGSVWLPFTFTEAELIPRQARDDGLLLRTDFVEISF